VLLAPPPPVGSATDPVPLRLLLQDVVPVELNDKASPTELSDTVIGSSEASVTDGGVLDCGRPLSADDWVSTGDTPPAEGLLV
jgi:hypothetical protein